jgi:hypothetical protein
MKECGLVLSVRKPMTGKNLKLLKKMSKMQLKQRNQMVRGG